MHANVYSKQKSALVMILLLVGTSVWNAMHACNALTNHHECSNGTRNGCRRCITQVFNHATLGLRTIVLQPFGGGLVAIAGIDIIATCTVGAIIVRIRQFSWVSGITMGVGTLLGEYKQSALLNSGVRQLAYNSRVVSTAWTVTE